MNHPTHKKAKERWKTCTDFPNYEVSSLGDIRNRKTGKVLRSFPHKDTKRLSLAISRDAVQHTVGVATLVGREFSPDYREELCPAYKDGDPTNCAANNLRWVERSVRTTPPAGEKHGQAKLTDKDVIAIRASKEKPSVLAKRYGVAHTTLAHAQCGRTWKHLNHLTNTPTIPR